MTETAPFKARCLLFATLVISICSIVYELIIGSLSAYLLGNSVLQFSLTIGLYLFAMGAGSYASRYLERDLFDALAAIEIAVGVIGGFSALGLFLCYIYTNVYPLAMYLAILSVGFLVGMEIPLLVRIFEQSGQSLRSGVANLFAFDYLGGLLGSLLFPLVLLPALGYVAVAFFTGVLNLCAAVAIVFRYRERLASFSNASGNLLYGIGRFVGADFRRQFGDGPPGRRALPRPDRAEPPNALSENRNHAP